MATTENRALVERVKHEMGARGLTAYALAKRIGVSLSTMSRVLAGEGYPSWETVQLLALALEISTDELRDGSLKLPEPAPARPVGRPRRQAAE